MNAATTRAILQAAHMAWSHGDLDGVLRWYASDIVYTSNLGGPNGGETLTVRGRDGMRAFLEPVLAAAESMTVIDDYQFADGVGRACVSCFIRHRVTRHVLSGSFRQVATFANDRVATLDELHDAAKVGAFWRLVASEAQARTR